MERAITLVPNVIENSGGGERLFDIYSRLLRERIVFLDGEITDGASDLVVAQLLFLEAENPQKEVSLYINSPGGSVTAGLAIYDTMGLVRCPVSTICVGQAASMAALILAGGEKGRRFCLPSSRVMIHQPFGGVEGQTSDIAIHAREIERLKRLYASYLAADCGRSVGQVSADLERDFFLDAPAALAYGLVDAIMDRKKKRDEN